MDVRSGHEPGAAGDQAADAARRRGNAAVWWRPAKRRPKVRVRLVSFNTRAVQQTRWVSLSAVVRTLHHAHRRTTWV